MQQIIYLASVVTLPVICFSSLYVCVFVSVCVCVCVCERERERESVCVYVSEKESGRKRERERICVCVSHVCVRERECICVCTCLAALSKLLPNTRNLLCVSKTSQRILQRGWDGVVVVVKALRSTRGDDARELVPKAPPLSLQQELPSFSHCYCYIYRNLLRFVRLLEQQNMHLTC